VRGGLLFLDDVCPRWLAVDEYLSWQSSLDRHWATLHAHPAISADPARIALSKEVIARGAESLTDS